MKYYYEPNDKWYDTKQDLVDAYNEDFEGTHSTKATIDNWTKEQWNTIWKPNMKKLEIKTEKATLLVVDLDKGAKPKIYHNGIWCDFDNNDASYTSLPSDNYKHLGKVSEITEEEWKVVVDDPFVKGIGQYVKPDNLEGWTVVNAAMGIQYQKYSHISFKDYQIKSDGFSIAKQYPFETAKESGLSLLKANGVLLENHYPDPGLMPSAELDIYRKTQEKVWPNPHVFIKIVRGN